MTVLKVLTAPEPILKEVSLPIEKVDSTIQALMLNMLDTMYHDRGIGLAAPQVGVLKRVIVLDLQDEDEKGKEGLYPLFMANPEITYKSDETVIASEGCLSLPEQTVEVERPESITVKYLDFHNNLQELHAKNWLARAIQHEIDHLDAKLLIDYLSPVKRDIAVRKLKKLKLHCI